MKTIQSPRDSTLIPPPPRYKSIKVERQLEMVKESKRRRKKKTFAGPWYLHLTHPTR